MSEKMKPTPIPMSLLHDHPPHGRRSPTCCACGLPPESAAEKHLPGCSPRETQGTITAWADSTFGVADREAAYQRMMKEIDEEMRVAYEAEQWHLVAKELPDVYITLVRLASRLGVVLEEAVDAKMQVNRARRWLLDGKGGAQHVDEPPYVHHDGAVYARRCCERDHDGDGNCDRHPAWFTEMLRSEKP